MQHRITWCARILPPLLLSLAAIECTGFCMQHRITVVLVCITSGLWVFVCYNKTRPLARCLLAWFGVVSLSWVRQVCLTQSCPPAAPRESTHALSLSLSLSLCVCDVMMYWCLPGNSNLLFWTPVHRVGNCVRGWMGCVCIRQKRPAWWWWWCWSHQQGWLTAAVSSLMMGHQQAICCLSGLCDICHL
jgi:hypothetical protein